MEPECKHGKPLAEPCARCVEDYRAGNSCEDEGCPHYGTPHSHPKESLQASDQPPAPLTGMEAVQLANLLLALKGSITVSAVYTNYKGEKATRTIRPINLWHGSTEWHPKPCLMLRAYDVNKKAERDFAMADMDMTTMRSVEM